MSPERVNYNCIFQPSVFGWNMLVLEDVFFLRFPESGGPKKLPILEGLNNANLWFNLWYFGGGW